MTMSPGSFTGANIAERVPTASGAAPVRILSHAAYLSLRESPECSTATLSP